MLNQLRTYIFLFVERLNELFRTLKFGRHCFGSLRCEQISAEFLKGDVIRLDCSAIQRAIKISTEFLRAQRAYLKAADISARKSETELKEAAEESQARQVLIYKRSFRGEL